MISQLWHQACGCTIVVKMADKKRLIDDGHKVEQEEEMQC